VTETGWRARVRPPRRVVHALALGVVVSAGVAALSQIGALAGWETRAIDAFLFFRDRVAVPDIVLVVIDEQAFHDLGERQPLSREYLATLGGLLLDSGASVVALDFQLRTPESIKGDEALAILAEGSAVRGPGRPVFATEAIPQGNGTSPGYDLLPLFARMAGFVGFANTPVGSDGVIRRMTPALPASDGGMLPSLPLAVLAAYGGYSLDDFAQALRSGLALMLPVYDRQGQITKREQLLASALEYAAWRIDFAGPPGSFTSFGSGPLVAMARRGVQPDASNPFRGRIVLVGATFRESRDFYATPVGLMAGVEIHANMINTLLSRRALQPPPFLLNMLVLTASCLALALLSLWLRPAWVPVVAGALVAAYVTLAYEAYTQGGYWLDFVAPLVGMLGYLQGSRLLARRRLRRAFGEFVSPDVMNRVLAEGARLGGETRTVSVLMSDLRGFTAMAERRAPAEVSETMNEYFTAMVDVILTHHGMIQDFIGDGILAIFGAPVEDPQHARKAVEAALAMQEALVHLNARWGTAGRAPMQMGVAVHSGPVFAGYVGSPRRKKYAVLGDTVNTVSRLEGLNRELGTAILISGAVLGFVGRPVQVCPRGTVTVKGRTQPVAVFELLGAGEPQLAERRGETG
jgi:adenylate cyclase